MKVININGYTIYRKFKGSNNNSIRNNVINYTTVTCQPIKPIIKENKK